MNDNEMIIYAGHLRISGWHRKACEVISPEGISTCIHCQSNNLLQKILVEDTYDIPVDVYPIGRERTDEEKTRRHLHGDIGATFSGGKRMCILKNGISGCVTTFATKDNLVCEIYEERNK